MTLEVKHLLLPSPIGSHEQTLKLKLSEHPPPGHHAPLLVGYAWSETASDHRSQISDGDSLGICWGRFTGALLFMSIIFHYVLLISILICTFDGCKIRIKGLRDCLDL